MGNGIGKVCLCSTGAGEISCRHENNNNNVSFLSNNPLGNSVCYVRPPDQFSDDDVTTFQSVSSASVSANSSTPPSTTLADSLQHSTTTVLDSSASFESSTSFTSLPMQQASRGSSVGSCNTVWWSPMERGFSSGPVVGGDGGLLSSPFDRGLNEKSSYEYVKKLQRSFSHNGYGFGNKPRKQSLKKILKRVFSGSIVKGVVSIRGCKKNNENANATVSGDADLGCVSSLHDVEDDNYLDDDCGGGGGGGDLLLMGSSNLQWAQGRAGEDRVHIVISEEHGWVFVGIYDGFNGPDATNYLLDNLFYAVHDEIKGLLCGHQSESMTASVMATESLALEEKVLGLVKGNDGSQVGNRMVNGCSSSFNKENYPNGNDEKLNLGSVSKGVEGVNSRNDSKEVKTRWEWREEHSEKVGLRKGMQLNLSVKDAKSAAAFSHSDVLLALSEALSKTEEAFLKTVNEMISNNPVLAMMGSCVLVMLMKGEDVYLMNVGDSRAVLATQTVNSLQLTMEHSTLVKEEVHRIRKEHPDDPSAVTKGRVKGYLNITRAFGAGFLKQPKQNNAVLETFKVNYIGDSPYITCSPSLHHHRLGPSDKFLILSSDGLYQYFTNEEAVAKVESFITSFPDRDPAQLLIEEALFRAAKKAGMDFHELLDIPQGERRLYHDDISVAIISFEGKIWRSSV